MRLPQRTVPIFPGSLQRMTRFRRSLVGLFLLMVASAGRGAPDSAAVQRDLLGGKYADVIKAARDGVRDAPTDPEWSLLLVKALLATGRNGEADAAMRAAFERDNGSIRLRWLARDV